MIDITQEQIAGLVERLRDRRACSPAQNSCRNDLSCEEAADMLEQLAAENVRLRDGVWRHLGEYLAGQSHVEVSEKARKGIAAAVRAALQDTTT